MSNNYPIEKQVCPLDPARQLAGLLGDNAPGSLWVWARNGDGWSVKPESYKQAASLTEGYVEFINAYTGDELGALLPEYVFSFHTADFHKIKMVKRKGVYTVGYYLSNTGIIGLGEMESKTEAQTKAGLAVKGLTEGWIKKKDFKYE